MSCDIVLMLNVVLVVSLITILQLLRRKAGYISCQRVDCVLCITDHIRLINYIMQIHTKLIRYGINNCINDAKIVYFFKLSVNNQDVIRKHNAWNKLLLHWTRAETKLLSEYIMLPCFVDLIAENAVLINYYKRPNEHYCSGYLR